MIDESGSYVAVVANHIIESRHKLNPLQQKVIAWAIGQIARDDGDFLTHTLHVSEFADLIGEQKKGQMYRRMEAVTESLLCEVLHIRMQTGDRHRVKFQWLSKCTYHDGKGTVDIRFHEELRPFLLELQNRFTQIRLDKFFAIHGTYALRFFERIECQIGLTKQPKHKRPEGYDPLVWQMTLPVLRDWLGIPPDSYDQISALKEYVLKTAQRQLDEKSDWSFSFVPMTTGRRVTGFEFRIRPARSPKTDQNATRWKNASADMRQLVLNAAKKHRAFAGQSERQILASPKFDRNLDMLFAEAQGQQSLDLAEPTPPVTGELRQVQLRYGFLTPTTDEDRAYIESLPLADRP
jgi:plasmid replication initiation protein